MIFSIRKQLNIAFGKLYLPEFKHKRKELLELIDKYNQKLQSYNEPINLMIEDEESFINTFRNNYEQSIAYMQEHYPIDVSKCSTVQFLNFEKILKRKNAKARAKKPGPKASNVQN